MRRHTLISVAAGLGLLLSGVLFVTAWKASKEIVWIPSEPGDWRFRDAYVNSVPYVDRGNGIKDLTDHFAERKKRMDEYDAMEDARKKAKRTAKFRWLFSGCAALGLASIGTLCWSATSHTRESLKPVNRLRNSLWKI